MTRPRPRLLAALALCVGTARGAAGQAPLPGQPGGQAPGARAVAGATSSSLDVVGDVFGGYDTQVTADPALGGNGAQDQRTLGANLAIDGDHASDRGGVSVAVTASARTLPAVVDGIVQAYSGTLNAGRRLGRRGTASLSQRVGWAPVNLMAVFGVAGIVPPVGGVAPAAAPLPLSDYGFSADNQLISESNASLSYNLSRRVSLRGGGGYSLARLTDDEPAVGAPPAQGADFDRWRANGALDVTVGRYAGVYAGYQHTEDRSQAADVAPMPAVQSVDLGVRYGRPLGFSRRTQVFVTTGSTLVRFPGQEQFGVIGSGGLTHEIGRTWRLQVDGQRNVQYLAAYLRPVTSYGGSAQVSGGISRRTMLTGLAFYRSGEVGAPDDADNDLETLAGSLQVRHGLTDRFGVYVEYFYARSTFGLFAIPVGASGTEYQRQGVRAGLSMGQLIAGRRRN